MHSILVVESSATQRYGLCRSLEEQGYNVTSAGSFVTGLDILVYADPVTSYDAIIIGWSNISRDDSETLVATLTESELKIVPVLVLSLDKIPANLEWVSERPNTAILQRHDHFATTQALQRLLGIQPPVLSQEIKPLFKPIEILLVDDSATARKKFRHLLKKKDYVVDTAANAVEAFNMASEHQYDIAIIDYFMPEMTGDELVRRLQQDPRTDKILCSILTSSYLDGVISDCLAAGAMECMFKSESEDLFLTRIDVMARMVRMTTRIERKQQRLASILSSVGDGVYGVNKNGVITFVNPAACQLLGYPREYLLSGINPYELFHCEADQPRQSQQASHLSQAIHDGLPTYALETIFERANGSRIQVELSIQPLLEEQQREGAVVAFRDISERKLLEEELKWQAHHDPLTKLLNRKFLDDVLTQEVIYLRDNEEKSALLYIDLDRFKYINDTIGHTAGDKLLIEISQQLQAKLREGELLARIGGDEFAILIRNINNKKLFAIADTFRQCLQDYTFYHESRPYNIHGSIGVAIMDKNTTSAGEVLSNADLACHLAKGKGRNQVHVFNQDEDDKAVMDMDLGWSIRLKQALQQDRFQLLFHPMVSLQELDLQDLPTDKQLWSSLLNSQELPEIIYEVLLRLPDSRGKLISPNAFLPTAERFNMMADIDNWVLNAAFSTMASCMNNGTHVKLSINLSAQCMDSTDTLNNIREGINTYQLKPENILFEVTESCAIKQFEAAHHSVDSLRKIGCQFALDDFGSGYSTFSQLKHLPVDVIKIDGQFVKDITHDEMDLEIVTSMVNIARTLGKKTVAEFVDSPDVLRLLKVCGVDYVQGNYITHPLEVLPDNGPDRHLLVD